MESYFRTHGEEILGIVIPFRNEDEVCETMYDDGSLALLDNIR